MNKGVKRGLSCYCCDNDALCAAATPENKLFRLNATETTSPVFNVNENRNLFITPSVSSQKVIRPLTRTPLTDRNAISSLLRDTIQYDTVSSQKRTSFLSWDDYFMSIAELSALRSKDPETPSGACLVHDQRVIAIGYNGFPIGCSDDVLPWKEHDQWLHGPSPYVVHAVANAVLNRRVQKGPGTVLYTRHFPCHECAKVIAQASDISTVVYALPTTCSQHTSDSEKASRVILQLAGIHIEQHVPETTSVEIDFRTALNPTERDEGKSQPEVQQDRPDVNNPEHVDLLQREAGYNPVQSHKRPNVLTWDDYFMALAFLTAQRSKDPNTTVGACIVDSRRHIVGLGYNGFPAGCSDDDLPWHRQAESALHTKYMYVCHAEVNAILNAQESCEGATIYVALFPCHACAQYIIQSRVAKVVYASDQYHDTDSARASRILFQMAGVELQQYTPSQWNWTLQLWRDKII